VLVVLFNCNVIKELQNKYLKFPLKCSVVTLKKNLALFNNEIKKEVSKFTIRIFLYLIEKMIQQLGIKNKLIITIGVNIMKL